MFVFVGVCSWFFSFAFAAFAPLRVKTDRFFVFSSCTFAGYLSRGTLLAFMPLRPSRLCVEKFARHPSPGLKMYHRRNIVASRIFAASWTDRDAPPNDPRDDSPP